MSLSTGNAPAALGVSWAAFQSAAAAIAVVRARNMGRADARAPSEPLGSDVVLVRPLAGAEAGLYERLVKTGGATRILLALRDERDGAFEHASRAVRVLRRRGLDASLVLTHAEGPNLKSDQLARALATLTQAAFIVTVADSDVDLHDDAVSELATPLFSSDGPDATFAPFACVCEGVAATLGDRALVATLSASLHAFPFLVGIDAKLFVGKLFAIRAESLEKIGGFSSLTNVLGEDVEIRRRLDAHGLRAETVRVVARATRTGRSLGEAISRMERWLLVVRAQRTHLLVSYPLLMAGMLPLLAFTLVVARKAGEPYASALWASTLVALLTRIVVSFEGRRHSGQRQGFATALVDVLASDTLLLFSFAKALVSRNVTWRGETLRVQGGAIARLAPDRRTPEILADGSSP
jgi:ceramide glucosyltransferase